MKSFRSLFLLLALFCYFLSGCKPDTNKDTKLLDDTDSTHTSSTDDDMSDQDGGNNNPLDDDNNNITNAGDEDNVPTQFLSLKLTHDILNPLIPSTGPIALDKENHHLYTVQSSSIVRISLDNIYDNIETNLDSLLISDSVGDISQLEFYRSQNGEEKIIYLQNNLQTFADAPIGIINIQDSKMTITATKAATLSSGFPEDMILHHANDENNLYAADGSLIHVFSLDQSFSGENNHLLQEKAKISFPPKDYSLGFLKETPIFDNFLVYQNTIGITFSLLAGDTVPDYAGGMFYYNTVSNSYLKNPMYVFVEKQKYADEIDSKIQAFVNNGFLNDTYIILCVTEINMTTFEHVSSFVYVFTYKFAVTGEIEFSGREQLTTTTKNPTSMLVIGDSLLVFNTPYDSNAVIDHFSLKNLILVESIDLNGIAATMSLPDNPQILYNSKNNTSGQIFFGTSNGLVVLEFSQK